MSFHIDYRPQKLSEIVGNAGVVAGLKKLLSTNNHNKPKVYLLSGHPGCGKTTTARIIARRLGATKSNIKEINVADLTGVDSMRAVVQTMRTRPFGGDCKCYIFDECHQWSNSAQNLMLKELEDTQPHVRIILCTTSPSSLLPAVRSRAMRYHFDLLHEEEAKELLLSVAKQEKLKISPKVMDIIISSSGGSPRFLLTNLEKISAFTDDPDKVEKELLSGDGGITQTGVSPEAEKLFELLTDRKTTWKAIGHYLNNHFIGKVGDASNVNNLKQNITFLFSRSLMKGFTIPGYSHDTIADIIEYGEDRQQRHTSTEPGFVSFMYNVFQYRDAKKASSYKKYSKQTKEDDDFNRISDTGVRRKQKTNSEVM